MVDTAARSTPKAATPAAATPAAATLAPAMREICGRANVLARPARAADLRMRRAHLAPHRARARRANTKHQTQHQKRNTKHYNDKILSIF